MRNVFQLTIFISGLILMISCGRKIDCPDFNDEILKWVPYQNNDTIRLMNSSNDSIMKLVINEVIVEHTTHYMTNVKCGTCDDRIMINVNETDSVDLQIHIGLTYKHIYNQSFLIKGFYFTEYNSDYSEQSDYSFEGVNYDVVRIFEKKETDDRFFKLIIAKGFGIIGLVEKNGDVWEIKSTILKSKKSESVEIRNISCG
jgi:hypothetical protein